MGEIKSIPTVITHEIGAGGSLGLLPDGTDSEETISRGRYRIWTAGTQGGKIEFPSPLNLSGFRVERCSWSLPGVVGIDLFLVDPDGISFLVGQMTGADGFYEWRGGGTLVPGGDGWSFEAVAQGGALTAVGRIMFVLAQGWGQPTLSQTGVLGRENLPPTMQRS